MRTLGYTTNTTTTTTIMDPANISGQRVMCPEMLTRITELCNSTEQTLPGTNAHSADSDAPGETM